MKFVIFFAVAFLIIEILLYIFQRSISWLFPKFGQKYKKIFFIFCSAFFVLILLFRNHYTFAIFTTSAVLLWFWDLAFLLIITSKMILIKLRLSEALFKAVLPLIFLSLSAYSYFNAYNPEIIRYEITLDKKIKDLKIVLLADLHLGNLIGNSELQKLNQLLAPENPDYIFLAGDIINDNPHEFLQEKMYLELQKLQAKNGVFGVIGNHEYYTHDFYANLEAIKMANIKLLWDEVFHDENLIIIGRDDYTNKNRKQIKELVPQNVNNKALILLDHQPREFPEAFANGIDIQLSGHTHNGQVFPINFIVKYLYPIAHGHLENKGQHLFVSSGFGLWGAPFRLGSRSEIVVIEVKGKRF